MSAEAAGDQLAHQPEHHANASGQLSAYIDKIEAPPRERLAILTSKEHPRQRLDVEEPTELQEEIARLERMKQEVQEGNFSSIAIELEARRAEPETRLAALRPQLRPRGEMYRDDEYFTLKEEILTGDRIPEKVKGVLDETELAWIVKSNEYRKEKQGETERGRLMRDINKEQQTLDEITYLQQLISQPPQP